MAAGRATSSPFPSPDAGYGLIADAIYNHCRDNHGPEDIFLQEDLLRPDIIPNKDVDILVHVCQFLVNNHLFKVHEIKGGGIGWKLNTKERAENYKDLSTDETLVYSIIESAGTSGLWTKQIKQRLNIHAKVTERAFKTLESKGLIEPMKNVKYPSRKMYILKGLKPSDEATGGAWFTDGLLDIDMITNVAAVIEKIVGDKSWIEVKPPSEHETTGRVMLNPGQKRKEPQDGFEWKGKSREKILKVAPKAHTHTTVEIVTTQNEKTRTVKPKQQPPAPKTFRPHPPEYQDYPTLSQITNEVNKYGILSKGLLPQNAIAQLLEVMVYDEKLIKLTIPGEVDESPNTAYKTINNPTQIYAAVRLQRRLQGEDDGFRKAAVRERELEDIGYGGTTEVPCLRCPVFHFCHEGGPVNPTTCTYFDDWFQKLDDSEIDIAYDLRVS